MAARIARGRGATGIGLTLLPVFYAHGGFGGAPPNAGQRRFINDLDRFARLLEARARRSSQACRRGRRRRAALPARRDAGRTARRRRRCAGDGPIHIHVAEQVKEVEDCVAWSGARPVEWLLDQRRRRRALVPDPRDPHDAERDARRWRSSGAVAGLCPITEANLGDGIFDGAAFVERGGRFGVGSDSNVAIGVAGRAAPARIFAAASPTAARNVLAHARPTTRAARCSTPRWPAARGRWARPGGGIATRRAAPISSSLDAATRRSRRAGDASSTPGSSPAARGHRLRLGGAAARWSRAAAICAARRSRRFADDAWRVGSLSGHAGSGRHSGRIADGRRVALHQRIRADIEARDPFRRLAARPPHPLRARADGQYRLLAHDREQGAVGSCRGRADRAAPALRQLCAPAAASRRSWKSTTSSRRFWPGASTASSSRRAGAAWPRRPKPSSGRGGRRARPGPCVLHWAGGRPFAAEHRLINLADVPETAESFARTAPGSWLRARSPGPRPSTGSAPPTWTMTPPNCCRLRPEPPPSLSSAAPGRRRADHLRDAVLSGRPASPHRAFRAAGGPGLSLRRGRAAERPPPP